MIHGTKKSKTVKSEQQQVTQNALAARISKQLKEFFELRNKEKTDLEFLNQFTDILMELCSDVPTIYNFRRQLILEQLKKAESPEAQVSILQLNLKLTTKLLKSDPKSYCIWSFRQWVVTTIHNLTKSTDVLKIQLQLCRMMLEKDEKNFHVWNYRNWLNEISVDLEKAIQFVHEKISKNPFNFSPYHFLTKHLTEKYNKILETQHNKEILQYSMEKSVYDEEMQKVMTAIVMGPNEQAAWNFYKWLIRRTLPCRVIEINNVENGYEIILNYKVYNFSSHLKIVEKGQKLDSWSLKSINGVQPSSQWLVSFSPLTKPDLKPLIDIDSNFDCEGQYVKTELGMSFIGLKQSSDILTSSKRLIEQQIQYVEEQVYIPEECKCRYAAMTLLQLFRLLLHFSPPKPQWEVICHRANKLLKQLKEEKKGQRYIQKMNGIWQSLAGQNHSELPIEEQCLLRHLP